MIPLDLLIRPFVLFQKYPVRDWRQITLWLKWGLLVSIASIILSVTLSNPPSAQSYVIRALEFLNAQTPRFDLTFGFQLPLLFIILSLSLILTWLVKGGIIYLGYRLLNGEFLEGKVALSIAGASLITNVWVLIPYVGGYLSVVHACVLLFYLIGRINRFGFTGSMATAIVSGIIPVIY